MDLSQVRELAIRLAREAGDFAVAEAATVKAIAKGAAGDVVTHVDQEAERRIIAGILAAYPDHAILGEESGQHGDAEAEYRWLVDPLDGTNNYVLGLGSYGVCITACRGDQPVVAVVHDSSGQHSYAAVAGSGATRDGQPITMASPGPLEFESVSWLQGYAVKHDDPYRQRTFNQLDRSCRRVLRTWSPSIDRSLVATGKVAAIIAVPQRTLGSRRRRTDRL
ncbi:MAG TPA: inositol monophosphatase family protein [Propionibacteriaceae bacterium]